MCRNAVSAAAVAQMFHCLDSIRTDINITESHLPSLQWAADQHDFPCPIASGSFPCTRHSRQAIITTQAAKTHTILYSSYRIAIALYYYDILLSHCAYANLVCKQDSNE
jgi:hypothetical protein